MNLARPIRVREFTTRPVWSEDSWLTKHAGNTLTKDRESSEESAEATSKADEEDGKESGKEVESSGSQVKILSKTKKNIFELWHY